ncbi:MAG: hypothetical protein CME39_09765 [Haliea sp.]|nr:hypothetical protein [Haliea sp.]|tara:strand:- start:374 stop:1051 length:678 start_codon:yes stop_codon:yes gene_type:complete
MKAGKLTAVIGASRSGKSQFVQRALREHNRVLVWDVKNEYPGATYRPQHLGQLAQCVSTYAGKPAKIIFSPERLSDFSTFCRAAQAWVKSHYLAGHRCALVIEETADVTSASKAPEEYGILLRRYLAYGVDIFAVTQRPAESDKTSIGNASRVHVCRVQLDRDRKRVAADTGIPLAAIESLRADQDRGVFDYLSADTGAGEYRKGQLRFPSGRAQFKWVGKSMPL